MTVKRWWRSKEIWNAVVGGVSAFIGLIAVLAPEVLPLLPTLGLTPGRMLLAIVFLNGIVHVNGIVLKMRSTSMIGGKVDVAVANEADAALPDPVEHATEPRPPFQGS